jgi:hypothetical protein
MRRILQTKYGDGGHGFVAAGRPWGWYLHQDVRHDAHGAWTAYDCSTDKASDAIGRSRHGNSAVCSSPVLDQRAGPSWSRP